MSIPQEVLQLLVPLVQEFEGCKLKAYLDGGGVPTIGFGHTGPEVKLGLVWTQEQADSTLATDLSEHYNSLMAASPTLQKQGPGRQAALTDFVYNLGASCYDRATLRSAVDCGAWESVKIQLARWNHDNGKVVAGLTRRRAAEVALIDA
jgi:lysozyme